MFGVRTIDGVLFTLGAALATALVFSVGPTQVLPRARAAGECLGTEAGAVSAKQVDGYTLTGHGTRSDVRIINGNGVDCQHVSSIYTWNGSGGFEVGYLIGFSNCPGHTGRYFTHPKKFYWAVSSQGTFEGCNVWEGTSLPEDTFQTFRGSDINANKRWGFYYNGTELQPDGIALDFSSGVNGWGMERGDRTDDGYARFNELSEYHTNTPGGWSHWDDQRLIVDRDPDFDYSEIDDYTGRAVR
jgi:hypothetical protein